MHKFREGDIIRYKKHKDSRTRTCIMILDVDLQDAEYSYMVLNNGHVQKDSINFMDGIYVIDEAAL